MKSEEINGYLENLEEFLFDEKKIVTCSWFAKTLGIHSNLAKQLLYTFFDQSPKKNELSVTYLLIGTPNDKEVCQVSIVQDKDLQEFEKGLKSITSKHIYSLQKCASLSDINVLYTAQVEDSTDTISKGISAIDFNCNQRDSTVLAKLKLNALPAAVNQPLGAAKKHNFQPSNKAKSPIKDVKSEQNSKKSPEKKESSAKAEGKGSVIPSMFKNSTAPKKKSNEKVTVNSKKPQGIGSFFTKTTGKPNNEPKKAAEKEAPKEEEKTESKVKERLSPLKENKSALNIVNENKNSSKTEDTHAESQLKPKTTEAKQKGSSIKVETKSKKKKPVKKPVKEQKQRKRLVMASESESENSSEGEEEMVREPTPEPEPMVIPDDDAEDIICGTPEPATKKRKKKLINKTFTSPDGYMVTEKEYVDVSCSEDEEAIPEKKFKESCPQENETSKQADLKSASATVKTSPKQQTQTIKNKKPSPQKSKQSSLMSFFKKK